MAKSARDLADRRIDGTYPPELRDMADLAVTAQSTYCQAEDVETRARNMAAEYHPTMRQIAADAYALWRLIETTCGPIVEAFEREQDARDTEEVEAKDAEEAWGPEDDQTFSDFDTRLSAEAHRQADEDWLQSNSARNAFATLAGRWAFDTDE